MTARCLSIALALLLLQACRGPRDPDLEQRLSEAAIEQSLPTKAPAHTEAAQPTKKGGQKAAEEENAAGLPPAGSVELRPYDDKELLSIMKSVPREEGLTATSQPAYQARITTNLGDILCSLEHRLAPQTTANFIALANGIRPWRDPDTKEITTKTPFFDGLVIHRAIKDFIIQTGKPGTGASSGPGWTIPREVGNPANYDSPGSMGMVDAGEDTHASQFFITLRAQKSLKEKYTPFGTCKSLKLLKRIASAEKQPPTTPGKSATKPLKPVRIESIRVTAVAPSAASAEPSPTPSSTTATPAAKSSP